VPFLGLSLLLLMMTMMMMSGSKSPVVDEAKFLGIIFDKK
jgi:hypothetical protein